MEPTTNNIDKKNTPALNEQKGNEKIVCHIKCLRNCAEKNVCPKLKSKININD